VLAGIKIGPHPARFDLLDGRDVRRVPIENARRRWRSCSASRPNNEHYSGDAAIIYKHACSLGCEGIVSKRLGSAYRGGRTGAGLKVKNPAGRQSCARPRTSGIESGRSEAAQPRQPHAVLMKLSEASSSPINCISNCPGEAFCPINRLLGFSE
jgi:hypothetical protein